MPELKREAGETECGESELAAVDDEVRRSRIGANMDAEVNEPIGARDTEEHTGDHTVRLE